MIGPGSFFEMDASSNSLVTTYALWQKGRKSKDLTGQFVPKSIDLPDERSQSLLSAMAAEEEKLLKEIEQSSGDEKSVKLDADGNALNGDESGNYASNVAKRAAKEASNWKHTLAKYCK